MIAPIPPLLLVAAIATLTQSPSPPATFRYAASQLDCTTFLERTDSRLETMSGARVRRETLSRTGRLHVRARTAGASVAIEAWYDSLALARESPGGTLTPDTDGLLGGRYRGTMTPAGAYSSSARPFVPDDVAEVANMAAALDDLFPPLPSRALPVGGRWSDGAGLDLERLPDSTPAQGTVWRLALRRRTESGEATVRGNSSRIPARQVTIETGRIAWSPATGVLSRRRHLVVETSVPAGGPITRPVRSRLDQEVTLRRVATACPAR